MPYRFVFALMMLLFVGACAAAQLNAEEPTPPKPPKPETPGKEREPTAKPPETKTPPKNPKEDEPPAGEAVDPTKLSPALNNAINPPPPPVDRPVVQQQAPQLPPLPEITLKAYVEAEGKPPAALIEINGKQQMQVTEGSDILVHGTNEKQYLSLKVKKVSRGGLEIEAKQLNVTLYVK